MASTSYQSRQAAKVNALTKKIKKVYEESINQIVYKSTSFPYKGELFSLSSFPQIEKLVNAEIAKMKADIYAAVINGVEDSWDLANEHNNLIIDKRLAGRIALPKVSKIMYDPNKSALDAFTSRKEKGLNLSERVWNSLDPFKAELEQGLGIGLGKGQSAASLASELKQYLNEPDRLFRKVRGEDGELYLSKAARNYHPGQGVYRSSYQNARRLTRTETNLAYRYSDHERWQNMPFIVGIEIRVSNSHGIADICDDLKGMYPKDYKFGGWHPACKCFSVSIQMTDDEYEKYEDSILNGDKINIKSENSVDDVSQTFKNYVNQHKKEINGFGSTPYWVKDNPQYTRSILK